MTNATKYGTQENAVQNGQHHYHIMYYELYDVFSHVSDYYAKKAQLQSVRINDY